MKAMVLSAGVNLISMNGNYLPTNDTYGWVERLNGACCFVNISYVENDKVLDLNAVHKLFESPHWQKCPLYWNIWCNRLHL